jgi:hypothetical protein
MRPVDTRDRAEIDIQVTANRERPAGIPTHTAERASTSSSRTPRRAATPTTIGADRDWQRL